MALDHEREAPRPARLARPGLSRGQRSPSANEGEGVLIFLPQQPEVDKYLFTTLSTSTAPFLKQQTTINFTSPKQRSQPHPLPC
jgi:hypothetical protein